MPEIGPNKQEGGVSMATSGIDSTAEFERIDGHRCYAFHEVILASVNDKQRHLRMKLWKTA